MKQLPFLVSTHVAHFVPWLLARKKLTLAQIIGKTQHNISWLNHNYYTINHILVHSHTQTHTRTHTHMHAHTYTHTHTRMHAHTYAHTHMHTLLGPQNYKHISSASVNKELLWMVVADVWQLLHNQSWEDNIHVLHLQVPQPKGTHKCRHF